MATVGAWVADQLVLFVQLLGEVQRGLGTEAVQSVGMTLQFGQIVQQGRHGAAGFGGTGFDGGFPRPGAGDDAGGFLAVSGQALDLGFRAFAAKPGTLVALFPLFRSPLSHERRGEQRREGRHHLQIIFRHKGPNGQISFHHHRQRRRLHPPDR